jgi:hypothetical protein
MGKKKLIGVILIGLMVVTGGFYPLYADLVRGGEEETLGVGEGDTFQVNLPVSQAAAGDITFELATEFPAVDNTMMVYKVKAPDVTVEKVIEMGRKLGFAGGAGFIDDATKISMVDESGGEVRQFLVWVNSGTLAYHFLQPDKLYPPAPPTLPSDEEAGKIATQFLAEAGLLPASVQVSEVVPGGSCGSPEFGDYVAHLLVRFSYEIDGFPVTGTGVKFGVRIGDKGEVVDLYRVWRETEPYKETSIKAPQEAYQDLVAGKGSYGTPSGCQKVVVEKISLAYWMEAADQKQEYVVPVYEFSGKCLDGQGNYLEDFTGWCQALQQ